MAAPDPTQSKEILAFGDQQAWERWLETNHQRSDGLWLKFAKKAAPPQMTTIKHGEALESALCFGWIDGQTAPLDEHFYLMRFTPRRPRSRWSQINRDKAERLIAQKRMRPAGLAQVNAAKNDGRWEAAYEPQSRATVPDDFQQALDQNPKAKEFFQTLKGQNRYAFLYRIQDAKRPETRARRIATFIEMLNEGRTFYP